MSGRRNKERFFIKTLGCKVNQYESQAMREHLLRSGLSESSTDTAADIYIVNSCTVTHHADSETRRLIGSFHRRNPKAKIIVTGCYAQRDADAILSWPGVARVLRNKDKFGTSAGISDFKGRTKAFVKIQDGCGNSCSYCKVRLVRGPSKSRPLEDIIKETEVLLANGFKEIVLVGVCLGAWGKDLGDLGLAVLIDALKRMKGDFRIRLSSIEPKYVTEKLVECIASDRTVCRHLHIPLQSGDDGILRKMNRPYTAREFSLLIHKTRKVLPEVAVTTDVMVGFPGESHRSFANTLGLIRDILPLRTHIFPYSPREGTAAYEMKGVPDRRDVRKWCNMLRALTFTSSYIYRRAFLNKRLDVLVETKRDRRSGMLAGYTDTYIRVIFDGPDGLMRRIVPVRIDHLTLARTKGIYEPV